MSSLLVIFFINLFIFIDLIFAVTYTCDSTAVCGCSAASTVITSRIVGGESASDHAWGWMISLRHSGRHRCGASLLSSESAVTAAHCVDDDLSNPSALSIVVGTNDLNDQSSSTFQRRTVVTISMHPNYKSDVYVNDIAIIRFSPLTVSLDSKLAFICLPNVNVDPFGIDDGLVGIGWGYTSESSGRLSNFLQQVTVQTFSWTSGECQRSGLTNSNVQFCAGISTGGKGKTLLSGIRLCSLFFY